LEQRTDGCELVESYTNYSVCACDHLTEFSIGALKKLKGLKVLFQKCLHATANKLTASLRRSFLRTMCLLAQHKCLHTRISAAGHREHEN
jgi:hypothetical protein